MHRSVFLRVSDKILKVDKLNCMYETGKTIKVENLRQTIQHIYDTFTKKADLTRMPRLNDKNPRHVSHK